MTELQKVFLFYVFLYYVFKGGLYVALYIATIIAEKIARQRHEQMKMFLQKKRADESIRWKVAYSMYDRKKDVPVVKPLELSQLINNPKSFTAYSNINSLKR
ncbi:MAG: hypothetical protein ACOX6E_07010 [Syntrophomonadaceae bacterium]|jgi:hypothetical protein